MANTAQQQNANQDSLLLTALPMSPVAVAYNVTSEEIENFIFNYLKNTKGVNGVATVRVKVGRDGGNRPQVSVFAFFDIDSTDIYSGLSRVPVHLRNRIETGGLRASDKLFNALKPLVRKGEFKLHNRSSQGLAFVELDVFKVFGLALAIDPRRHFLNILETQNLKKGRAVISVMKSLRNIEQGESVRDRYDDILRNLED